MEIEFPYLIKCQSTELQNSLIHIFSDWAEKINQRIKENQELDNSSLKPLEIKTFEMEKLTGRIKISDSIVTQCDEKEIDENNFLTHSVVMNGVSIKIDDFGGFISNEISLVFLHQPESKLHGISLNPYFPKQTEIEEPDEDSEVQKQGEEIDKLLQQGIGFSLTGSTQQTKPDYDIKLYSPCFFTRFHIEFYKKILGTITAISPQIQISTITEPLLTILNNGSEVPEYFDYNEILNELADEYLQEWKLWI